MRNPAESAVLLGVLPRPSIGVTSKSKPRPFPLPIDARRPGGGVTSYTPHDRARRVAFSEAMPTSTSSPPKPRQLGPKLWPTMQRRREAVELVACGTCTEATLTWKQLLYKTTDVSSAVLLTSMTFKCVGILTQTAVPAAKSCVAEGRLAGARRVAEGHARQPRSFHIQRRDVETCHSGPRPRHLSSLACGPPGGLLHVAPLKLGWTASAFSRLTSGERSIVAHRGGRSYLGPACNIFCIPKANFVI